jgi:hypothetical protein
MWTLTLIFVCCGMPLSATLPNGYSSHQACQEAGSVWMRPESNPVGTIKRFSCFHTTVSRDYIPPNEKGGR